MTSVDTASRLAGDSRHRRFRVVVVAASVVAAVAGSALLAMRDSGGETTTLGVTATLPVPGHPGAVVAGTDELWVALADDARKPAGNRPLVRLDLATGRVARAVYLGGDVAALAHVDDRLIASIRHPGSGLGELAVLDWRSGAVLDRDWDDGPVDEILLYGNALWALAERPGTLLRLDPKTLAPAAPPLRLSPGRALALASGGGYLWVTAADSGEVLRIDPATRAIRRVHVGGFPIGIAGTGEGVWFADNAGGTVARLDQRSLQPLGEPIRVGTKPGSLATAGDSLFVADQEDGTIVRIDVHSGKKVGLPIRIARPAADTTTSAPSMASAGLSVWVTNFAASTLTRISSTAARDDDRREVTVRIAHMNEGQKGDSVTDGGVAGTGDFTLSGSISDNGKVVVYRTVQMPLITLRYVAVGKAGTITFVVKIDTGARTSQWTIASATRAYQGLHGEGIERENGDFTVSTLTGTVSR